MSPNQNISKFQAWILAARPKTLLAAMVPVLVGCAFAKHDHKFAILPSIIALLCSFLIQIGTNFTNDLFDFLKGADNKERVGPIRVLNEGLVSKKEMVFAISLVFGTAFFSGLYLVYVGGVFILVIGILSIISGIIYTAGPYPLAYNGLGDLFSFIFFGIVGTVGTYFVNTLQYSNQALLASIPVGSLITAILVVNNYRDIEQDRKSNKNTLAVKFGKVFSRNEYIGFFILSYFIPTVLFFGFHSEFSIWIFLPYLSLPLAFKLIKLLFKLEGQELNKLLELTAKFSAVFGVLLSLGAVL